MTKREIISDYHLEESDKIRYLDEPWFDDALLGSMEIDGRNVAVYSSTKCIECLMVNNNMSLEEATEYFDYNVIGAYMGEYTPKFVEDEMICYE